MVFLEPAHGLIERPRYFPRQLITPVEMTLEQNYFRDKLRRHNRLLHGWGAVCGALVCAIPASNGVREMERWKVRVQRGYILGPYGDEIMLDCEQEVDVRTVGKTSDCAPPGGDASDPWCSDVFVQRDPPNALEVYIAVRYKEVPTRPVRVPPAGCGGSAAQCEYSRFCDGYEIGVLHDLPASHENPPAATFESLVSRALPGCPVCPDDPWVVLAKVTVAGDGAIDKIDNCSDRRVVISFGQFWWRCKNEEQPFHRFSLGSDKEAHDLSRSPFSSEPESKPSPVKARTQRKKRK